jgi:hypothetical protein
MAARIRAIWGAQAASLFVSAACRDVWDGHQQLNFMTPDVAGKLPATAG